MPAAARSKRTKSQFATNGKMDQKDVVPAGFIHLLEQLRPPSLRLAKKNLIGLSHC